MAKSTYMRVIWKGLPLDVLEHVLAYLPRHALCRLRLVCRDWNSLVSHSGFAARRTRTPRPTASSILIAPKLEDDPGMSKSLTTLDAMEKRSYKVFDSFIAELDGKFWLPGWFKYTLAVDGGLIYTMYSPFRTGAPSRRVHVVCDPVRRSYHEIPEPELYFRHGRDIVVMSVDNETKAYKIIIMECHAEHIQSEEVYMYDSTTSAWRKLCDAPETCYHAFSSVIMNGIMYTLYVRMSFRMPYWLCPKLYSCDLETGVWESVDVDLPRPFHRQNRALLVVCMNRLFMVEYTGRERRGRRTQPLVRLRLCEIALAEKKVVNVTKTRGFSRYSLKMVQDGVQARGKAVGDEVVAVGCANLIVISCVMGERVKFDILKNRWNKLPAFATDKMHDIHCKGICAGLVDF